jgi:TRAP-type C4-dicarboxylate transport system substrate-binding protein
MRSNKLYTGVAIAATLAVTVAGCGGGGSAGEKSGGDEAPLTLRLGAVESETAPYADEVEEFADAVETSDESIDVEVVWEAAGPYTGESERKLAEMVSEGEIDLAVVPTRVWDQLDVSSFQALQAPFLVDDLGLLNEIAASDLATEMLGGLDTTGTKGLAIWPESLRHPVGFQQPLLTTADFEGAKLRVPASDASLDLARAIGVEPVDPPDMTAAAAAGEMEGAESAFVWAGDLPGFGTFTANITFYPKANTIVANADAFADLSGDRQDVLQRAASDAVAYVVETNATEQDLAAQYCADGGSVAIAQDSDLAELADLATPLLAELEQDADTERFIDEIRALKEQSATDPAASPAACDPETAERPEPTDATAAEEFPEGVYRAEFDIGGGDTIVATMSFRDGVWEGRNGVDPDCTGTYVIESGRILMSSSTDRALACGNPPGYQFLDSGWTFENDELRFVDIDSDPTAVRNFGSLPWTKIE